MMQRAIILILAVIIVLPVVFKSRESRVKSAPTAFSVMSSSPKVLVRVSGDVAQPGIYSVVANTMTDSVINMAMNDVPKKYQIVNKSGAKTVAAGMDIHIRKQPDGTALLSVNSVPAPERMVLGIPLEINNMSEADFVRLPGIGPVMAKRIVMYRQNNGGKMRVEDLLAVEGIGDVKYKKLSKYF